MKKVLHVAETITGGVATVIRQLASIESTNSIVLAPNNQSQEISSLKKTSFVGYERTGRNVLSFIRLAFGIAVTIIKAKPDIVHFHSTFAGVIGRPIAMAIQPFHKTSIIYSPHGWSFIMNNPSWKKKIYSTLERALLSITYKAICVSNYEKDIAVSHGLSPSKLLVIHNSVEAPLSGYHDNPYDPTKINIIYIGRFDFAKGFDILTDAMNGLDNRFHLTAIGASVHECFSPNNSKKITYTGWLNRQEIARYIIHSDVLVIPSRWEAFCLVAVEAQSYGIPAIASRCCSLPEVVLDQETGHLIEPGSADAIIDSLNFRPKEYWNSFRDRAISHYKEKFTSDIMQQKTNEVYRSI